MGIPKEAKAKQEIIKQKQVNKKQKKTICRRPFVTSPMPAASLYFTQFSF